MHPLLARQLKRLGLEEGTPPASAEEWTEFLRQVGQSYVEADQGHALLERSLALSSKEMQELYAQLKQTSDSELAQERNKLKTVLQSLGDGLCVVDAEWKIQMTNHQAEQLVGMDAQTLLGRPVYHLIAPGPEEYREECLLTDVTFAPLASGEPYRTDDGLLITAKGQLVPISLSVTPMLLEGIAVGAVLAFRDITRQKQVERERLETENLLRRIQSGLSELAESPEIYNGNLEQAFRTITKVTAVFLNVELVSIWFLTDDHASIQCAKLYQRYSQEFSQGSVLLQSTYPRYFQALEKEQIIAADDAQHDPRTEEFTQGYLAPRGITSMLDVPIRSGGRMVGVLCHEHVGPPRQWTLEEQHFAVSVANTLALALEAADRKKVEQALRTSEGRLTTIVQSTNIGIWDWDLNSNEVYLSAEWKRQLGYEDHELSNTFGEWESRIHPDDHDHVLNMIEEYMSRQVPSLEIEHRLRHKDGTYRWILTRGTISKDESTLSSRLVGIHIDVTDRRVAEEVLRQAKEAAEAASLAKSQFLANMSHEIRTPMNGVLGLTDLLVRYPLGEKERQLTQSIHRSGTVLLSIINDILDFSKIEAGKLQLETVPFQLHGTIREAVELSEADALKKQLKLSLRVDERVPRYVLGDPMRLRQVLVNLVSNAIKFTERGTVAVDVTLKEITHEQYGLSISVADTGIGIAPEAQVHIFDAFSQADGSTTRKYGGTGLGLAIVKQLVTMMGGTITLQSQPGAGSCFQFTAYFQRCDEGIQLPFDSLAQAGNYIHDTETQRPVSAATARILLVEDNPVNREVACGMLEMLHCQIDTAENGREALDATAKAGYDLVLMDCQMPKMDGFTATKLIRAREVEQAGEADHTKNLSRRHLPIVALTAHAMQGDREQCLSVGMDDYITKPFTLVQIEQVLSRWLPNWSSEKSGRQDTPAHSATEAVMSVQQTVTLHISDQDAGAGASAIDPAALDAIRALQRPGQPDLLIRVVSSYLDTSQEIVKRIRAAVESRNAIELRAASHRLKSSSAQLGACAVAEDCRELEMMGKSQEFTHADEVLRRFEVDYAVACMAFKEELAKRGSAV